MKKFVICDIEATGPNEKCEIIEIALITWSKGQVRDSFDSLVNPLCPIPPFVSELTSISQKELLSAPKFYEISSTIESLLEGAIFVSHKTDFDFNILKRNFKDMGVDLRNKCLCTLQLAKKVLPGLKSYNLDTLCQFFGIKTEMRHRAFDDAVATLELLKKLLSLQSSFASYENEFWGRSEKKSFEENKFTLPHHLKIIKKTPSLPGLLYFKSQDQKIIDIEATSNMQDRLVKKLNLKGEYGNFALRVDQVLCEKTGMSLIGELKKSITYFRRLKWKIIVRKDRENKNQFRLVPLKKTYRNKGDNVDGLWFFSHRFEAVKKLKSLQKSLKQKLPQGHFLYRETPTSKEEVLIHNRIIEELCRSQVLPGQDLFITGEGRDLGEKSFVLVRHSEVIGYGFSSEYSVAKNPEDFIEYEFKSQYQGYLKVLVVQYLRVLKNINNKKDHWKMIETQR